MKFTFFALLVLLALGGCAATQYSVTLRQQTASGVTIFVDVPEGATPQQLTGWCGDITAAETNKKTTQVHFGVRDLVGHLRPVTNCHDGKLVPVAPYGEPNS